MFPGAGGLEYVVIAILALVIIGPKDLPRMLRKFGQITGKVRRMANEFRSSFDEMARQSELDELRQEVEALRSHQYVKPLGPELEDHFREISSDLQGLPSSTMTASAAMIEAPTLSSPMIDDTGTKRPDPKRAPKPKAAKPPAKKAAKPAAKRAAPKAAAKKTAAKPTAPETPDGQTPDGKGEA